MRSYIRLALFFYYKKIEINYEVVLPPDQPTLLLGNHQNGLMDPLLIATRKGQFSYFLTRASVFQNQLAGPVLRSLLMLPVYRIRDGWTNLSKNTAIFKACSQLLYENKTITLFPEGDHNIKRQVRTLSKGFTRIIAEALEDYPDLAINLVPVGFNYKHAEKFADQVVLNFGTPLSSTDYNLHINASTLRLKQDVFNALTNLTTHIADDDYELVQQKLNDLNVDFLNPELVNKVMATSLEIDKIQTKQKRSPLKTVAKFMLCATLFLPYGIWKLFVLPQIKEPEFIATFRFTVVLSLVPIFMLVMVAVLWINFGILYALLYVLIVFVLDMIAVKL